MSSAYTYYNEVDSVPTLSLSEAFGRMDQELAAKRNARVEAPKVVKSRIRVQLSRTLTWAEKEDLEKDELDSHERKLDGKSSIDGLKLSVSPERTHVWAEATYGSRHVFDLVSHLLADTFVNVYPTAVRTFREYNGE